MDGALVIDKPAGPTSHDVVARVRRLTGVRRIGHTGTLDPMATGVLPLVLGRATRLARFITQRDKTYEADIRLGVTSDTYDATGRPSAAEGAAAAPARLPRGVDAIEAALEPFRGTFLQTPPAFSAKKVNGVRAYARARRGQRVDLAPVRVTTRTLELLEYEGDRVTLTVECSAGFYVRSLAHDLGDRLGCGARLEALRRTRSGEYDLSTALALEALERDPGLAATHLIPMRDLLPSLPAVVVNAQGARRVSHGRAIGPDDVAPTHAWPAAAEVAGSMPRLSRMTPADEPDGPGTEPARESEPVSVPFRVMTEDGALLAIGTPESGVQLLHPVVVLI